ncbi:MAG: cytochrome c [Parvibaculaceae bacterium]
MRHRTVLAATLLALSSGQAAADGASLYSENCVACHQVDGAGTPGLAPPLISETLKKAGSVQRDYVALVVIHGLSGPIKVKGQLYVSAMPPRDDFSDDDVAGLANYVTQELNGLTADQYKPLATADVALLRKTTVDHQTLRDMRSKFGE